MGINAPGSYFIAMDADSVLDDALESIAKTVLEDDRTVACGGLVRIANGAVLKRRQAGELPPAQNFGPGPGWSTTAPSWPRGCSSTCSTATSSSRAPSACLRRRPSSRPAGDTNTLGEDMELVVRLHEYCRANRIPYVIKYASDAVCWSQAPRLGDLRKQRRRWHIIGMFQSIVKHRQLFLNPKYGLVGLLLLPLLHPV